MEVFNPEKSKPKIYLPEVRAIIENDKFLRDGQKVLTGMSAKKDTLHHCQRMTNLGYLLAKHRNFSEEETRFFVEACLLHDIGKAEIPQKYLSKINVNFGPKDLKIVGAHVYRGYACLKGKGRSPRVYNSVLMHHQFQVPPYPAIGVKFREIEDVDVDNARLLAMLDVFDVYAFGRPHSKTEALSPDKIKEKLMAQFNLPDKVKENLAGKFDLPQDEEIIDFLISKIGEIRDLQE